MDGKDKKEEDQEQERNQNMKTTPPSWKNNFTFYGLILTTIFLITSLVILLWIIAELKENVEFNTRALSKTTKILAEKQGQGILITGGVDGNIRKTTEAWSPFGLPNCILPNLTLPRYYHTQNRHLACGGEGGANKSCETLKDGSWTLSHTLQYGRDAHTSWDTYAGIYLLGGSLSPTTSELVTHSGTAKSFDLKYSTSNACGIKISDNEYVMTGGSDTSQIVSKYSQNGWIQDLPTLNIGRRGHGCGSYTNGNERVLIVFGGGINKTRTQTSSTEILSSGSTTWTIVTPLPKLYWDIAGVSINNVVYGIGGISQSDNLTQNTILRYDAARRRWLEVGSLKAAKWRVAADSIEHSQLKDICDDNNT